MRCLKGLLICDFEARIIGKSIEKIFVNNDVTTQISVLEYSTGKNFIFDERPLIQGFDFIIIHQSIFDFLKDLQKSHQVCSEIIATKITRCINRLCEYNSIVFASLSTESNLRIVPHGLDSLGNRGAKVSSEVILRLCMERAVSDNLVWTNIPFDMATTQGVKAWFYSKSLIFGSSAENFFSDLSTFLKNFFEPKAKVIFVDLDNTLWGGVVGDDGKDGLRLGVGDPLGEPYVEIQKLLLQLKTNGYLLVVVSKNDDEFVKGVIDSHPEMVLQLSDFIDFRIGWGSKSMSIERSLEFLNLGHDSFIFIDDNPAERLEVASKFPAAVVIGDESPFEMFRQVKSLAMYQKLNPTEEDSRKTELYISKRRFDEFIESRVFSEEEIDFAVNLDVRVDVESDFERCCQLLNKTNQFNFNPRRISSAALRKWVSDEASTIYSFRMTDRFGYHGIVGCATSMERDGILVIFDFVVSCRVLGRGVEHRIVDYFSDLCVARSLKGFKFVVSQTDRNKPARLFYESYVLENVVS